MTSGNLLDLYLRDMSFLEVHLYVSCTLILLSQGMAQDKIVAAYYSSSSGLDSPVSNHGPVLFQLFFRNSSILEFLLSSTAINIWLFRFLQYFPFLQYF